MYHRPLTRVADEWLKSLSRVFDTVAPGLAAPPGPSTRIPPPMVVQAGRHPDQAWSGYSPVRGQILADLRVTYPARNLPPVLYWLPSVRGRERPRVNEK
jgi:hypothetical protein